MLSTVTTVISRRQQHISVFLDWLFFNKNTCEAGHFLNKNKILIKLLQAYKSPILLSHILHQQLQGQAATDGENTKQGVQTHG